MSTMAYFPSYTLFRTIAVRNPIETLPSLCYTEATLTPDHGSAFMPEGAVLFEAGPHQIARITIHRPDVRNALNWAAMDALRAAIDQASQIADLRAVIVYGAGGKAFISGGDLRDLHSDLSEASGLRQHDLMVGALDALASLPVPVIAALEGATRGGGCEVALACDLRVAASDATLGFAQIGMGVTPGWGGASRLISCVGYTLAMELLLTGRTLTAAAAQQIGLVTHLAPPGETLAEARRIAEAIAQQPPLAVRGVKQVLHGWATLPADAARARERSVFARLWATTDHAEASTAFLEKRPPVFQGK